MATGGHGLNGRLVRRRVVPESRQENVSAICLIHEVNRVLVKTKKRGSATLLPVQVLEVPNNKFYNCCNSWFLFPACPALVNTTISLGPLFSDVRTLSSGLVAKLTCTNGYKLVGLSDGNVDCLDVHINSNPTCRKGKQTFCNLNIPYTLLS